MHTPPTAREIHGNTWGPIRFPMPANHVFELILSDPSAILFGPAGWVAVESAEPIARWEVGTIPLRIRGAVYLVRVCATGECVVVGVRK